jgi:hypothetical protein
MREFGSAFLETHSRDYCSTSGTRYYIRWFTSFLPNFIILLSQNHPFAEADLAILELYCFSTRCYFRLV